MRGQLQTEEILENGKRKRVNTACLFCKRSHLSCDNGRPCSRCIKRGISEKCRDPGPKTAKILVKPLPEEDSSMTYSVTDTSLFPFSAEPLKSKRYSQNEMVGEEEITSQTLSYFHEFSDLTDFLDLMAKQNIAVSPGILEERKSTAPMADREIISTLFKPNNEIASVDVNASSSTDPTKSTSTSFGDSTVAAAAPPSESLLVLPLEPLSTAERYFLTASCSNTTSDEILDEIIRTKYEAGYIKPYNYVYGYTKLNSYIKKFTVENQKTIYHIWDSLRLLFRDGMYNATEMDLLFIEESFERLLLDYDRVFACIGTPSCLYRRDGAIFKANREFAALVKMPVESFVEGNYGIYELMTEESVINYWDKFGTVYHDPQQKAVLTTCTLKSQKPNESDYIKCCFSFTLRRDKFNIPFCIVGHFIPIEQ